MVQFLPEEHGMGTAPVKKARPAPAKDWYSICVWHTIYIYIDIYIYWKERGLIGPKAKHHPFYKQTALVVYSCLFMFVHIFITLQTCCRPGCFLVASLRAVGPTQHTWRTMKVYRMDKNTCYINRLLKGLSPVWFTEWKDMERLYWKKRDFAGPKAKRRPFYKQTALVVCSCLFIFLLLYRLYIYDTYFIFI